MIPVWLQMVTALSAAAAAGTMGMALVPFLRMQGLCDLEKQKMSEDPEDTAEKELLHPTMGGLLLCFGIVFGLVLGVTLLHEFGSLDRTAADYRTQTTLLRTLLLHAGLLAAGGFAADLARVRGKMRYHVNVLLPLGAVFLLTLGLLLWQEGMTWTILLPAAVTAVCWQLIQTAEKGTDGMSITLGTVQFLIMTVILLKEKEAMPALLTLAGAGACMGCMIWGLHPAKCRLGSTGSYLLGSMIPLLCAVQGRWKLLALTMAVYAINALPLLKKGERLTLLERMERSGMAAWKRITILTCFAVFCGILAVVTG
ncbi:MAG: hypothetical protein K5695_10885 [Oscillospiraceae bacterium]|nr:hypothetical protein [Oscillospiraceae bacterium]